MDWANEPYILVYVRDTGDWLMWGWQTRALLLFLLRKVDRAGVLDLGRGKLRALAKLVEMPEDVLVEALEPLLEDGCVQIHDEKLVIPNFMEAQETSHSDRVRKQMSRERARSHALSQSVTTGHDRSQSVTLASNTSKTTLASESDAPAREDGPGEAPEEVTNVRHISSRPPPSEPTDLNRIRTAILAEPKLADLDAADLAGEALTLMLSKGLALDWILAATRECASKSQRGELAHVRHGRLIGFWRRSRPKPGEKTANGPASKDFEFAPGELEHARVKRMAPLKLPAAFTDLFGRGPGKPMTEAELRDKAQADQRRLAEAEMREGAPKKAEGT